MNDKIKGRLFILLLGILLLPVVQHSFHLFGDARLYGNYTVAPDVDFSTDKWWSGEYWDRKSKYINDAVGFRPVMIKVNNQLNFSLFNRLPINIPTPIDNCLFFSGFSRSYSGQDFIGWRRINGSVKKLKAIQDTLGKLGKSLILVYAPGKDFFYPEYAPVGDQNPHHKPTNYSVYAKMTDSFGINQVDFNAWFLAIKGKTKDQLFTRQGIHWSMYGATLAADSIVRYMEKLRHIKMPHPVWTKVEHTRKARYYDDDVAQCFNLIFPYMREVYSYPEVSYPKGEGIVKPRVIYIGDSFAELWIFQHFMDYTDADWRYWYYFKDVWERYDQDESRSKRTLSGNEWIEGINYADCIILMYSPSTLNYLGNGFIEKAYDHYFPSMPVN